MARIAIRPIRDTDLAACAALLAARQRLDRRRLPMLADEYESRAACEHLLGSARGPLWHGAVAERGGKIVGFLLGERQLHSPRSYVSYFVEPYSIGIPPHGLAAMADADAVAIYRRLYAALADGWVRRGFFVHTVRILAGDLDAQEAWLSLGFGRKATCAVRTTEPVARQRATAAIAVRQATGRDLDVVMRLVHVNALHHARAPLFWPYLHETVDAMREYVDELLRDPETNAHLMAYRDGEPIALQNFTPPTFLSPLLVPPRMVYLFHGVVEAGARGDGVGSTLLDHAMTWARARGHAWCALHFGSANVGAASFWRGHGFVPVEHTMTRRLDERVAWADGRDLEQP